MDPDRWTQTAGPTDRWTHGPLDPCIVTTPHRLNPTLVVTHSLIHLSIHSTRHICQSSGSHLVCIPQSYQQSCQLSHSRADSSRRSQSCRLQPSVTVVQTPAVGHSRADSSRWSQSCRLQPSVTVVPTPAVGHSRAYSSRRSQSCRLQPSVTVVQTPAVGHSRADSSRRSQSCRLQVPDSPSESRFTPEVKILNNPRSLYKNTAPREQPNTPTVFGTNPGCVSQLL